MFTPESAEEAAPVGRVKEQTLAICEAGLGPKE